MMIRRFLLSVLVAATVAGASAQSAPAAPKPLVYYAGQAGRLTTDRDAQGGNPFASALVLVLKEPKLTLADFGGKLAEANARFSGGWQQLQMPKPLPDPKLRLDSEKGGKRVALVLINADYSKAHGVYSLAGARFDAQRVPAALREAGFETTLVFDRNAEDARKAIAEFAAQSASADASLIYVGGHGMQHVRTVYWMMGDYPEQDAKWLPTHAISLDEIGKAGQARSANLVLYASCRDDPFRSLTGANTSDRSGAQ